MPNKLKKMRALRKVEIVTSETCFDAALSHYQMKEYDKAISYGKKYFDYSSENNQSKAVIFEILGNSSKYTNNFKQAEKYYKQALQLSQTKPQIYIEYALLQIHLEETDKALIILNDGINKYPNSIEVEMLKNQILGNRGLDSQIDDLQSHYNNNYYDKVIEHSNALESKYPIEDTKQKYLYDRILAFSYYKVNKIVDAEKIINRGIEYSPNSIDFFYLKTSVSHTMKESENTISFGSKYFKLIEENKNSGYFDEDYTVSSIHQCKISNNIGNAYADKDDFKKASIHFQNAIKADSGNHVSYQNYVRLLKHNDSDDKALEVLQDGIKHSRQTQELKMMTESFKQRPSISASMIVKDEEKLLPGCLDSIRDWVDEIILVDTGSTDKTVEIAKSYGAKIYHQKWEGNFSKHRNYSIDLATGDWIFIIDADERFDINEVAPLLEILRNSDHQAISVNVYNYIKKSRLKVTLANSVRLFRRETKLRYEGIVHNSLKIPEGIKILRAPFSMEHLGYDLEKESMDKKFLRTKTLLEQQIDDNPEFTFAWFNYAQLFRGKLSEDIEKYAPKVIEAALKSLSLSNPGHLETRFIHLMSLDLLACTYFSIEDYQKAKEYAELALKHKPEYLDPLMLMGHIYCKTKEYDLSVEAYNKYLEVQKNYNEHREVDSITLYHSDSVNTALYGIGAVEELKNNFGKAKQLYHKVIENSSDFYEAALCLGNLYYKDNDLIKAEKYFRLQIEEGMPSPSASLGLAQLYFQKQAFNKAEKYLLKAIEFDPNNPEINSRAGQFYFEIGNGEEAAKYFTIAISLGKNDLEIQNKLAEALFKIENYDQAIRVYKQILEKDSDSLTVLNDLGNCYFKIENYSQAELYYQKAISSEKAEAVTFRNLGLNFLNQSKHKSALETLKIYMNLEPDDIDITNLIGELCLRSGEYQTAIEYFEQILKKIPDFVPAIFNLSECYLAMGQGDAAVMGYQRVLSIDPDFKPVIERLKELEQLISSQ